MTLTYKPQIDALRFVAIFAVLIFHFAYWIGNLFSSGSYGVNLFFVLSGFLITNILLSSKGKTFKSIYFKFIIRRAFRIFPIYYLTIIILIFAGMPHVCERLPWLLTYTYNFITPKIDWINEYVGHFWSLSVEEQFYLFYPFLIITLRKKRSLLMIILIGLIILSYAQIFWDIWSFSKMYERLDVFNYTSLVTNMAPLCIGGCAAILANNGYSPEYLGNKKIEILLIVLITTVCLFSAWKYLILFVSFLNCILVIKAYQAKIKIRILNDFLNNKYVIYLGRISYGLYIYHAIINKYLDVYIFNPFWLKIPFSNMGLILSKLQFHSWIFKLPLYTIISIIIAHLSFRYIEEPFLLIKDKYFKY